MEIRVSFPGGKRVDAQVGDMVVRTDQPVSAGGEGSAPGPFDLFLASIGTCAGIYALGFCQARGISTDGMSITQQVDIDPVTHLATRVRMALTLPRDFPERYRAAIVRAAENCKVKKTLAAQPPIEVALAGGDVREEAVSCVVA